MNGTVDFNGGTTPGTASTYQSSDSITGTAGSNVLNLTLSNAAGGAIAGMTAPNINGIQTINIRNVSGQDFFATGAGAYDVANFGTGVTAINATNSTGKVFVNNIASGTSVGVVGNGVVTNADVEAAYKGTVTANTLNISGGTTAGTVTILSAGATGSTINVTGTATNTLTGVVLAASATTLTVNAATGVNFGSLTSAGLTTATITGAASTLTSGALAAVKFGGTVGTATVVDASAMTAGGVELTLNTGTTSFKGGQGNDAVTTAALTSATAGIIDAGAGTGDRLINTTAANLDEAVEGAKYVNFEIFRNGAATQQDISLVSGITSLETSASGAGFAKMTATQAAAVTVKANNAGAIFALTDSSGTSDVLSVTLNSDTAATTASLTTVTVNGFETMNVVSSGKDNVANNSLGFTAATSLTALNLSGANKITVATGNLSKAIAIDGSNLANVPASGAYTLTLSGNLVKGSVVTGSANADSITTTAAIAGTTGDFVTYNTGAGNDAITTTLAALNNTSAANGSLKIDGGTGTTDTISTDANTYVDANFQYVTNVEKLTFTGAGATNVTTGGFFDTNFKTNGVTFTDATADSVATVIDASTFTGKVTAAITQTAGGGAVTDSYILKTGSAGDTITLVTPLALTSTNNAIQTNGGEDTVTITAAAGLDAAGLITVNLGSGADTLNVAITGAGLLEITGGTGADTFNLGNAVHTGVFNLNQGVGASGTFAKPSSNTISTTTFDISASGNIATDTITLANTTTSVVTQATDLSAVTLANDCIIQVKGTYNSSAGTFVGAAGGADSMFIYDSSTGATTTYESIVIVGNGATATAAAGVITLA